MPTVKAGDISIYYEVEGEGEPLVLIPGIGLSMVGFRRVMPVFGREYRVIAMDNRGAGQSDKPDIPYTLGMLADDVAALLDTLEIEKAHVFGLSMGGMVAQVFALRHPERLMCLVLGATLMGGPHNIAMEASTNAVNPDMLARLTPEQRARYVATLTYTDEFIADNAKLIDEIVAQILQNPSDPVGMRRQFEMVSSSDTYDRLPDIKAPTLIIAGNEDKVVSPENSRILASRIPNGELVMLEGVGHALTTMPETQRAVLDFLKRHTAPKKEQYLAS